MSRTPVTAALVAALAREVRPFLRRVQAKPLPKAELSAWEFAYRNKTGVAALSGMGGGAAARAATFLFEHYQPQVLISLGFGGAITPELPAGALVLGERFWEYEPDAGSLRELSVPPSPVGLQGLLARLQAAGLPAFRGSVVTTPVIIHKDSQGSAFLNLTHPVLDLETVTAAASVLGSGLPFLALRAVTDTAGEEIPDFIRQAAQEGTSPTAGTALAWLAADPRRLAALVRLWRRSRLAAENLAQALEVVLEVL
jgi:adenosylhomocysteine nucleosidase